MSQDYVLGFAFDEAFRSVLLIEKTKPAWQAGLLNGVGGKVEETDDSYERAMSREFEEECGLHVHDFEWNRYATLEGEGFHVAVFWTKMHIAKIGRAESKTEENIGLYSLIGHAGLRDIGCVSNVPALVELALDKDVKSGRLPHVTFSYK